MTFQRLVGKLEAYDKGIYAEEKAAKIIRTLSSRFSPIEMVAEAREFPLEKIVASVKAELSHRETNLSEQKSIQYTKTATSALRPPKTTIIRTESRKKSKIIKHAGRAAVTDILRINIGSGQIGASAAAAVADVIVEPAMGVIIADIMDKHRTINKFKALEDPGINNLKSNNSRLKNSWEENSQLPDHQYSMPEQWIQSTWEK